MLTVFATTFPIFAMVALGYGLVSFRIFKPESVQLFSYYVMNVALPALIFNAVSSNSVSEVMDEGFLAAFALGSLATIIVAFLWFSVATGPVRRSIAVMGSTTCNSGFVGYPLMAIAFPDIAQRVLAMNMLVEAVLVAPITFLIFASASTVHAARGRTGIRAMALNILRRPVVLALLLGLALSTAGIAVPAPVMRLTSMIEDSAAAIALLVIGGAVAGLPMRGNRALAGQIVAGKLLLHPLMTFLAVLALGAFGITLGADMYAAVLLSAAVPMPSLVAALAHEVDQAGLASLALLGAVIGAFFTLSALLMVLT